MTEQRSHGSVWTTLGAEPASSTAKSVVIVNHLEWLVAIDTPVRLGLMGADPAVIAATLADAIYNLSQAEDIPPRDRHAVEAVIERLHDDVIGHYTTPRSIATYDDAPKGVAS